MMSRWPRVTGSNDPGQRAVATQAPPVRNRSGVGRRSTKNDERIAECPLPAGSEPVGRHDRDAGAAARRSTIAPWREPARRAERAEQLRRSSSSAVSYGGSANTRSNGASGGRPAAEEPADVGPRRPERRSPKPSALDVGADRASSGRAGRARRARRRRAPRQRLDRRARRCPRRGRARPRRRSRRGRRARRTSPRARCPSSAARRRPRGATSRRPRADARDHPQARSGRRCITT